DDDGQPGAVMKLSGRLALRCERCNAPLQFMLERDVPFRFVQDEQELNARPIEDDEMEEVVGSPSMDLLGWVEDEAILSLPLVPRHEDCAVPYADLEQPVHSGRPNPFAVLANLKRGDGGGAGDG
ncbi:MAG: YceD family protein, partial [Burkholderiaceae bacterium]